MQKMLSYVRRAVDHYHMIEGRRPHRRRCVGRQRLARAADCADKAARVLPPKNSRSLPSRSKWATMRWTFRPCRRCATSWAWNTSASRPRSARSFLISARRKTPARCAPRCAAARCTRQHSPQAAKRFALGHHFDDVVENLYAVPVLRGPHLLLPAGDLSRPHGHHAHPPTALHARVLCSLIRAAARAAHCAQPPALPIGNTKRQEIKDLLKNLEQTMPGLRERIFGAIQRYPLQGWAPDRTRTPKRPK